MTKKTSTESVYHAGLYLLTRTKLKTSFLFALTKQEQEQSSFSATKLNKNRAVGK